MSGRIIVISGPSGVGKGTLCKALLEKHPKKYVLSISATSRLPRANEVEGRDYFFKEKADFEAMIAQDKAEPDVAQHHLLEWAIYNEQYYGTLSTVVNKLQQSGKHVLLEIDTQGALQIREKVPEALLVFIAPPKIETLKERLESRGSNSEQDIQKRLTIAKNELLTAGQFDVTLINDAIPNCVALFEQFTEAQ